MGKASATFWVWRLKMVTRLNSFITDQELSRGSAAARGLTSPQVCSVWAPGPTVSSPTCWAGGITPLATPSLCKGKAETQARTSATGRHLPHWEHYTINFYIGSQDCGYEATDMRGSSKVLYQCVLQGYILRQSRKRSCWDDDSKPTACTFPRTPSRMARLKSYNNVRKYFHPNNKTESKPHSAFLGRSVCYYKKWKGQTGQIFSHTMNLLPSRFWLDAIAGIKLQMCHWGESRSVHPHASGELYHA